MPLATNSASFETLALPLIAPLYNHAFWLTRDRAEAEDLVQETLAKALRAFSSFQTGTNFKAWAFRILRNTFLTSRTGLAAAQTVFLEDQPEGFDAPDAYPTVEAMLIQWDDDELVRKSLEQMQPQLREVLLLCDVEELKYKEIALILDVPMGTVMSRMSRARTALREQLRAQGGAQ